MAFIIIIATTLEGSFALEGSLVLFALEGTGVHGDRHEFGRERRRLVWRGET